MAMLGYSTFARATSWASPIALFQAEVAHHPHSSLDNGELAAQYSYVFSPDADAMESYYFQARSHFETAAKLNPNDTKALFGLLLLSENRGKIPEESWIKELDERLEYAPYAAVTSDKLVNLTKCRLAGECQLNSATLKELLAAALRNKSLAGTNRAKVLYALSSYLINEEQDYDEALDVMKQMIAADPAEPAFRLPLIRFLLALNRHEETRKELNILKRMDVSGSFTLEIENLETELSTQN
jgi:tetratricopeptide (TPR) repeat protein